MKISKNSGKIVWGLFFILAAVYLIVSRFVNLPEVGVFSILLTVFCVWMFIQGIRQLNFWGILFSLAFVCIIYAEPLGITALTPWPVLGAALLGSIGLSMIFKKKNKSWNFSSSTTNANVGASSNEQCSGEHIRCENCFGSSIKYINSDNFCNADLENSFGSLSVYFDNAVIQSGMAYVNVENSFGETELYIPKEWNTVNEMSHSFGEVQEKGRMMGTSTCTLYLRGETSFGTIVIHYI